MTDLHLTDASQPSIVPFEATMLSVSLTVSDVQRSLDWYCTVLGFALNEKYERDGKLIAASLRAGVARLLLTQDDGARGERTKGEGFSVMFTTALDVDAYARRIEAAGVTLDAQPADNERFRAFRLRDRDGFHLVMASEHEPPVTS